MLSNARVYIFGVIYKGHTWISMLDANELSGSMARVLTTQIPNFKFKNIQILNSLKENDSSCEIHINKIRFDNQKVLSKEDVASLRRDLTKYLPTMGDLKFNQILVVNDEFSREPSVGFLGDSNIRGPE